MVCAQIILALAQFPTQMAIYRPTMLSSHSCIFTVSR